MARPAGLRLTIDPLLNMLDVHDIDVEFIEGRLNTSIRQGKLRGFLTLPVADEVACKVLKMHPFEIWGQEYEVTVWHDMHDEEEATVIAFPVPEAEPVAVPSLRIAA